MATKPKTQRLPTSGKDVAALLLQLAFVVLVSFVLYEQWAAQERPQMSNDEFVAALAEAEGRSPALVKAVHEIVAADKADRAQSYLNNDLLGTVAADLDRNGLVEALEDIGDLPGTSAASKCGAVLADPPSDLQLHLALAVLLAEGAPMSALDDLADLALHHGDSFMRGMAATVSAGLGQRAGQRFVSALSDAEPDVRLAAAKALAVVDCPEAGVAGLQAALADGQPGVSVRCAVKLVIMGDGSPATVKALMAGVTGDHEALRTVSLQALGSLPDGAGSEVAEVLLMACAHDDAEVRWQAGQALARLGEGALPALLEASASQAPRKRFWATRALAHVPEPSDELIAALIARLDDSDRTVHTQAAAGMGAVILAGGSMEGIQAETMGISGMAFSALLAFDRTPDEIEGPLLSLLGDAEPLRQMLGIKVAVALSCDGDTVMAQLTGLADQPDTSVGRLARLALAQL